MAEKRYKKEVFIRSLIISVVAILATIGITFTLIQNEKNSIINSVEISGKFFTDQIERELKMKFADNPEPAFLTVKSVLNPQNMGKLITDPLNSKDVSTLSIDAIAIWAKNEAGKIENKYHSNGRYSNTTIYGLTTEEEPLTKDNVKDYFNLKIENKWIADSFDSIKGAQIEPIRDVLKSNLRETVHFVRKINLGGKDFLLDMQYSKRSILEVRYTQEAQKTVIAAIFFLLVFLTGMSMVLDKNLLMHMIVVWILLFTIYPIAWVFGLSFKSNNSLGGTNLNPIPKDATISNYKAALFNLKKSKQDGLVVENGQIILEESPNNNGKEFEETRQILDYITNFASSEIVSKDQELVAIHAELKKEFEEFTKESNELHKKYRELEMSVKKDGKKPQEYGELYNSITNKASQLSSRLDSGFIGFKLNCINQKFVKIKGIIEKKFSEKEAEIGKEKDLKTQTQSEKEIQLQAERESLKQLVFELNRNITQIENIAKEFKSTGKKFNLATSKENIKLLYNGFDEQKNNIIKEPGVNFFIEEKVELTTYNDQEVELITNRYLIALPEKYLTNAKEAIFSVEYYRFFDTMFLSGLRNSIFVSLATALLGMMLSSAAAYAFSRFRFPGRDGFMMSFLVTQMFPGTMMLIPLYIIFSNLGLINTFKGLILAYSITALPFNIWNLKGFFDTIPKELEEAALIDGCSASQTFYIIVLPLSLPALAISSLFSFMGAWNEYIMAATFMNDEANYTVPVVIKMLITSNSVDWPMFATESILVSIPVVIVFLLSQKYLVGGLTAGGVKG